jgi:hypothetical protein
MLLLVPKTKDLDLVVSAIQLLKFPDKILHVRAGPAVNMRRIFLGQNSNIQEGPHRSKMSFQKNSYTTSFHLSTRRQTARRKKVGAEGFPTRVCFGMLILAASEKVSKCLIFVLTPISPRLLAAPKETRGWGEGVDPSILFRDD